MTVEIQVATLTKPTTGTDGQTQDLNLNFTPKAIYVISNCNTINNTTTANAYYSVGFSDGTNQACTSFASPDNRSTGIVAMSHRTDSVFCDVNPNFSLYNSASVTFATNKVVFTWNVMDTQADQNLIVFAIGGSDITNVKVNTVDVGRTTTGTQDYTGLGFTPTAGNSILFTLSNFLLATNGFSSINNGCSVNRGVAISTSKRWVTGICSEDGSDPTDTWRFYDNAACLKSLNFTGAIDYIADFSAWISDGFRLNYTDAPTTSTTKFSYMVIKGGNWDVGSLQSPTTPTNNVDYSVSVNSNTLRGLLIDTVATATLTTAQTIAVLSTGVTDGTTQACVGAIDEDAQATSDSYKLANTTNIIKPLTTDGATLELATFDSFTTNNFRLDWGTASAAQEYYGWVVVADSAPSTTPVTQTNTLKFSVDSQIIDTNTLKFSVETPITSIKTQKFDVLTPVTKTNTLKFNVESKVTNVNTLKFSVDSKVTDTNTLKFNVESKVTDTNIIKFDVLTSVTSVKTLKFSVESKVTDINTIKFNVENYITKTKTHKYNVLKQIPKTRTHVFSVLLQVTRTHTHKYNVSSPIIQVTATKTHKYNVDSALTHITKAKTHKYHVIGTVTQIKTHPFSVLQRVSTTKTHKYSIVNKVQRPRTHVFSVIASITSAKTHVYNVLAQISRTRTHKYNIIGLITRPKTHKYHVEGRIATTKTHKYNIAAVIGTVTTPKTHLFSVLQRLTTTKTHKFSVLTAVTRTRTHKYHVVGLVTRSKTHKFNIIQKITVTKIHKYSILVAVPAFTKTHRYVVLKLAARTRTHKYNVIGRIYKTKTHRYQMGGKVILNKIHKFSLGSALGDLELGGSTFANIRFQDRVRIIDIIADLNNTAIANIEIPVARPPENLAIAVVGIAEYSSRLLTASANRPRHRVASTLITPQVIDTIDNLAVAPYIGIEVLPLTPDRQFQTRSHILLQQTSPRIQIASQTQLSQNEKTKIRIASATMLQQTQETVVESRGQLEITPTATDSLTQIIAPEIMTKQRAKVIRTLINLLSNDKLFD